MKCRGTVIASIDTAPAYTPHPPVIRAYTRRKPRRRLAMIVNDWGFFHATPSYCIHTGRPSYLSLATAHQLLSVRMFSP